MPKKPNTAVKKPTKVESTPKDETLEQVLKDFKTSWDYCSGSWHDRWSNNYKLYNNTRVKRGYEGITDTFVPMVFGTVETKTSALYGAKPKFSYLPHKNKPDQKTDILNALLNHYWEKDQWSLKVINTGRTKLQIGVGVDYFMWCGDHPEMINVPLRDFFIDATSTSGEDARYMGRRYLTTKEELESYEIVDIDNPVETPVLDEAGQPQLDEMGQPVTETTYEMKKKYKNLDQLEKSTESVNAQSGSTQEKTDQQEKNDLYGSTLGDNDDQVEVIEWWTEDKVVSVANRKVVIEDEENYFKAKDKANGAEYPKGLMPFAWDRCYVDSSLFYAKSEVDFMFDQQELLNDITNQNIDSITFTLNQMYTLDPKYADSITEVENIPGAVYPFEANMLMPIPQRSIPPDAFNERMNIKNEIRETTASNEVVKGAGESAGAKATATEINAQVSGSGQRMGLMITQMENEYFHRMARIVLAMIRLYVTEPMMVRIVGKDGAKWEQFDPAEFKDGEYEPRVQLDIAIQNDKEKQAAVAKEMLAAFLNDPDVNQQWLKKNVLAKGFELDPDEVEEAFAPNPMMQGAIDPMTGQPMTPMGGMPPDGAQGQPPMTPEDVAKIVDHLNPATASDLPPDVALQAPSDATPEELDLIRQAVGSGK